MAGIDPATHETVAVAEGVDARIMSGHDDFFVVARGDITRRRRARLDVLVYRHSLVHDYPVKPLCPDLVRASTSASAPAITAKKFVDGRAEPGQGGFQECGCNGR